jgi:hypothetical protein
VDLFFRDTESGISHDLEEGNLSAR